MLETDVTVDTNVFMHCDNESEIRCESARKFVKALLSGKASICVDEGFSAVESQNRSAIGSEYLGKLHNGDIGYAAVAFLAANERVRQIPKRVMPQMANKINRWVRDKTDRVFAKVAMNSTDKLLVSHDFHAFTSPLRAQSARVMNIRIVCAEAACPEPDAADNAI